MNSKRLLFWVVLAALAIRLQPAALPSFTDPDHYYHLRLAEATMQQQSYPSYDILSYQGRVQTYYPAFHLLLASSALLLGLDPLLTYLLFSLLVFGTAILAIFALAKRIFGEEELAFLSAFLFALLPGVWIRSLAFTRPDVLAFLLLPVLVLFLQRKKAGALAILGFFLPLLHPFTFLVASALAFLWFCFYVQGMRAGAAEESAVAKVGKAGVDSLKEKGGPLLLFFLGGAAGTLYYLRFPLLALSLGSAFASSAEMQPFQYDFVFVGLGILWVFLVVLVLERPRISIHVPLRFLSMWFAGMAALALWASRNITFLAVPASLLGAVGLQVALQKAGGFRNVLWGFVALATLLALLSNFVEVRGQYSLPAVHAAQWLGRISEKQGGDFLQTPPAVYASAPSGLAGPVVVLSAWDRGHLFTYYGASDYMDGYFEFAPQRDQRLQKSLALFLDPSPERMRALQEQGVSYVYVDSRFPLERSPFLKFSASSTELQRVFDNGDTLIWKTASK